MLDPSSYHTGLLHSYKKDQVEIGRRRYVHSLDHFTSVSFPVEVSTLQDVRPLLNTMQEGRFEIYMSEMGGLTDVEFEFFVEICVSNILFQCEKFPQYQPVLPLSVLMSVMVLWKKLQGAWPLIGDLLEIGPGCGYLSFLFQTDHNVRYSQVEACQSFYLLQSMVNSFCFQSGHREHVLDDIPEPEFWRCQPTDEFPPKIEVPNEPPRCEHFPWWKIGDLAKRKFNLITANANWLEMNPAALDDYARILPGMLNRGGVVVSQCCGAHIYGGVTDLIRKFDSVGLENVYYGRINDIDNALWILKDDREGDTKGLIERVFNERPDGRHTYFREDVIRAVQESL